MPNRYVYKKLREPNTRFLCLDDGVYDVEEQTIREASPEWFFTSALPVTIEEISVIQSIMVRSINFWTTVQMASLRFVSVFWK